MFDALNVFFESLMDAIRSIVDFIVSFGSDTVYVIKLTASFVKKIPEFFSWLPTPVVALIVSIFAVVVVYKVLGREG